MKNPTPRTLVLAAAVLAVLAFSLPALAQGPGGGPGKAGCGMGGGAHAWCDGSGPGGRGLAHLDLSDEQQEAVAKIREETRAQNQDLRKEMLRLRNELHGELLKDEPAAKTVDQLAAKIGELRTKMQQNRLAARLAVREQLTPEQRDKMLLAGERCGRGGRHGGHRCGDCDGRGSRMGRRGHGRGPGGRFGGDCPRADDD